MNIIKETRERLGITQTQFATLIGANFMTISKWERGFMPALWAERTVRIINKLPFLPKPSDLSQWIEIEGGQIALERLLSFKKTGFK